MNTPEIPDFISNWQKYNSFLKKQDSFFGEFFKYYQGRKTTHQYERVLAGMIHRYALNFRSIHRCWIDFRNDHNNKFPIYTLLRPLLADFLLMLYLLEEFKFIVPTDDKSSTAEWRIREDDFIKRYENVSSSFFERMDSYLKKKVKSSELSVNDAQDYMTHHRDTFPEFFEDGPKVQVMKNRSLTPSQMSDHIIYGKQFKKDLYDYYFRLSQFEHFTLITEHMMHEPDNNFEMMYIVGITDNLLNSLAINISTLLAPQELKDHASQLINEFRSTNWKQVI